jgi:hypothetical protein
MLEEMTITDRAKAAGLNRSVVYQRLQRGWSLEEALTRPVPAASASKGNKDNPDGLHPLDRPCEVCGKPVRAPEWKRLAGWGRFCSPQCNGKGKKKTFKAWRNEVMLCGERLTLVEMAAIAECTSSTVYQRIRAGRSAADALLEWNVRRALGKTGRLAMKQPPAELLKVNRPK